MKIQILYGPGSVKKEKREDRILWQSPSLVGVIDGYSEVHYPGKEQINFGVAEKMITGGQMAANAICKTFAQHPNETDLKKLIRLSNQEIKTNTSFLSLPQYDAGLLPGASFAIAKIQGNSAEIIRAGDCLVFWLDEKGMHRAIKNICYPWEQERLEKKAKLMEKHKGNQRKMWEEFGPWLARNRQETANIHYPILNGQNDFLDFWNNEEVIRRLELRFTISRFRLLILFTDGLVPFGMTINPGELGFRILELYKRGGLETILAYTRMEERQHIAESHIPGGHAEATAIEIMPDEPNN